MTLTRTSVSAALADFELLPPPEGQPRGRSAVAVVLTRDDAGELSLLLTRRSPTLRSHKGQWALPGGRVDPGETIRQTALRELAEELGVVLDESSVLGELDDFVTRSGYHITPVVIWAADIAVSITANPAEVASVHVVPVQVLDVEPRFITIAESDRPVIQVPLFDRMVHAPTGAILHQFREVVLHGRATRVAHFEQPVFAWK